MSSSTIPIVPDAGGGEILEQRRPEAAGADHQHACSLAACAWPGPPTSRQHEVAGIAVDLVGGQAAAARHGATLAPRKPGSPPPPRGGPGCRAPTGRLARGRNPCHRPPVTGRSSPDEITGEPILMSHQTLRPRARGRRLLGRRRARAAGRPQAGGRLRSRRQVRQILQRGRLRGRREVQEGDRRRVPRFRAAERRPARAGAAPLRPRRASRPIVAVGFSQATALEKVAAEFPDMQFAIIDIGGRAAERALGRVQGARGLAISSACWPRWPRRPARSASSAAWTSR